MATFAVTKQDTDGRVVYWTGGDLLNPGIPGTWTADPADPAIKTFTGRQQGIDAIRREMGRMPREFKMRPLPRIGSASASPVTPQEASATLAVVAAQLASRADSLRAYLSHPPDSRAISVPKLLRWRGIRVSAGQRSQ